MKEVWSFYTECNVLFVHVKILNKLRNPVAKAQNIWLPLSETDK